MAQSIAFDGYGVTFGIGDGSSSEAFVDVAEVLDVSGPSYGRDTIDVSHATSPNKYREFIDGFKDAGEVSLNMNFTQASYASFLAKLESDGLDNYKITIPDDNYSNKPTIVFAASVTGIEADFATEDKVTAAITMKVSGKPTYTQGT